MAWDNSQAHFDNIARAALEPLDTDVSGERESRAYQEEYCVLKRWFRQRMEAHDWKADEVRLGGLMIYGWMPTILRVHGKGDIGGGEDAATNMFDANVEKLIGWLKSVNPEKLEYIDIDKELKNFLNRSYVGTSKFLHFCFPDRIAIWDSRICEALEWGNTPSAAKSQKRAIRYQELICDFVERRFRDEPEGALRKVELALFNRGKVMAKLRSDEEKSRKRMAGSDA